MKKRFCVRPISVLLCLALAVCLGLSLRVTGSAASFTANMTATASNAQYYGDGSLKSVDITAKANTVYASAYGKFAVHKGDTAFGWDNKYSSDGTVWPASINDPTFVSFGDGSEFQWTDMQSHTVTISFAQGQIPANVNQDYSILMWTRSANYGVYPDFLVGTLSVNSGKTYFNNTDVSSNTTAAAPAHTHHWVVSGDNTDTLTATCTGSGTCDKQSVSAKISASSVTLPDTPYNAVISGAEGFQSQTGLKLQPLADKGRAAYKFKAVGADSFTDPDLAKAQAGTYQAIMYVTDDDNVTHSAFVEYTAIDPVKTAATGDNRPIELMVLGLGMFCAMAAASFALDRKRQR